MVKFPLNQLTVQGMETELLAAFLLPNMYYAACRRLRSLRKLTSADGYAREFRSTYYSCADISASETRARFIDNLKPHARLYVKERNLLTPDGAILLV